MLRKKRGGGRGARKSTRTPAAHLRALIAKKAEISGGERRTSDRVSPRPKACLSGDAEEE